MQGNNRIAGLALLFFGAVSLLAYRGILENETAGQKLVNDIIPGEQQYCLYYHDKRVGRFQQNLSLEQGSLFFEGTVRYSILGKSETLKISSWSYFNPLNQLVGARVLLEFHLGSLELQAEKVNPIELTLKINIYDRREVRKLVISGPIVIERAGGGKYRVVHKGQTEVGIPKVITTALPGVVPPVQIVKVDSQASCQMDEGNGEQAIDLDAFIEVVKKVITQG